MSSNAPVCWENSRCEQRMNKVVVMTSDSLLRLEDSRREEERSRLSCGALTPGQSRRTDGQNTDLLPCAETTEDTSHIKYRRYGARLGGVKVRHKRQALQDMARPLKHWLYKHRDNPYPTKTEKVLLALGSHMTLVQVSNWFANARRRLKNTVRQPDLSWALRIKLYNKYIQGNAERLSVCSDDTNSEDEDLALQTPASRSDLSRSSFQKDVAQKQVNVLTRTDSANSDDSVSPPSKYKSSLLNRYLNDTLHHVMAPSSDDVPKPGRRRRRRRRRSHSESFSSIEYDEEATSPACSSEMETNFVYHMDTFDYASTKCNTDQDWREIHAAMALTNLAQGQQGAAGQSCRREPTRVTGQSCRREPTRVTGQSCTREPTRVTGQSCTREPISVTGQICTSGPTGAARTTLLGRTCATGSSMWQSCAVGSTLTSCIIQKSSHISEIKTVKLALENSL